MRTRLRLRHWQVPTATFENYFSMMLLTLLTHHFFFSFFFASSDSAFICNDWCRMCVCECARVERTSEGELSELLSELITKVASNNRTGKGGGGLSVDSGSLAGQSVTASNPPPAAVIKSVCACVCVCVRACVHFCQLVVNKRFGLLAPQCPTTISTASWSRDEAANTTPWTHFFRLNGEKIFQSVAPAQVGSRR